MMVCRLCGVDRIPDFIDPAERDVCRACAPPAPLGPLPYRPTVLTPWDEAHLRRQRRLQVEWARIRQAELARVRALRGSSPRR